MSASLLGLPLEQALAELAKCGVPQTEVQVRRSLSPRRDGQEGEWRVVRACQGEQGPFVLDVCCFVRMVEV